MKFLLVRFKMSVVNLYEFENYAFLNHDLNLWKYYCVSYRIFIQGLNLLKYYLKERFKKLLENQWAAWINCNFCHFFLWVCKLRRIQRYICISLWVMDFWSKAWIYKNITITSGLKMCHLSLKDSSINIWNFHLLFAWVWKFLCFKNTFVKNYSAIEKC